MNVWEVGIGGGVVDGWWSVLETKQGCGVREGGVGPESGGGGEEIGTSKVGGDDIVVCLTVSEV